MPVDVLQVHKNTSTDKNAYWETAPDSSSSSSLNLMADRKPACIGVYRHLLYRSVQHQGFIYFSSKKINKK